MVEQAQVTSTEAPVTNAVPNQQTQEVTPKVPDDMGAKFAALAKKERLARQAQYSLKSKETSLAERERQVSERERLWEGEFKQSPLEALRKRGYSYEDLTKAALNDGKFQPETEIKEVKSEFERFKQEQADKEKKAVEEQNNAAQKAEEQAVQTFKSNIQTHLETNKDKYELTALYEAEDLVFQTVEEHYLRTQKQGKPKIMSLDEACGLVESYIENQLEITAEKSKKFQSKYQALKAKAEFENKSSKSSTTLTNDLVPSSAAPSLLSVKTENDRIARALAALG